MKNLEKTQNELKDDLEKELEAADKVGYQVNLVIRPGNKPQEGRYKAISSFQEVQ